MFLTQNFAKFNSKSLIRKFPNKEEYKICPSLSISSQSNEGYIYDSLYQDVLESASNVSSNCYKLRLSKNI
jgi:hypothetical protein